MEKIWLKQYPPGVPHTINPDAYSSLPAMFDPIFKKWATRPAFYSFGTFLNYAELDDLSLRFASYLKETLQLPKGSRVALMLPNILQYPVALFGVLRAGMVVVNVNPLYKEDELVHQLNDSGAETLLVLDHFAVTVQGALPRLHALRNVILTKVGDLLPWPRAFVMQAVLKYWYRKIPPYYLPKVIWFKSCIKMKTDNWQPVTIQSDDLAFLQYTGGTTGIAKGAMLTHRNIIGNLMQADAWLGGKLLPGQEIVITALPLYHIFSLVANCLYFTHLGCLNVLIANPRMIDSMIEEIRKFRFTVITGVNTLFNGLLKSPKFASLDFSGIKFALGGGMAVQPAVAERWHEVTKSVLLEAYGLTETSPCVTINPPTLSRYNGSIGLPVPSTDLAILDKDGNECPLGKSGELAVKGPQVMKGYWQHPKETAKVFIKGWLLTGDIARFDDRGFVYLLERKKDMILVSGFNVYPNEVESVLASMPGIKEVAVVGVPDENSGEVPQACIVKEDPLNERLTSEAVIHYCKAHLTGYKVPKYVIFYDELPKTNVGKILRRALRK